jgi:hypothetical protein
MQRERHPKLVGWLASAGFGSGVDLAHHPCVTTLAPRVYALVEKWTRSTWPFDIRQLRFAPAIREAAAPLEPETSAAHLAVLSGMAAVEMVLLALVFVSLRPESDASKPVLVGCQPHVELRSAAVYAKEFGAPESWMAGHHKINIWSSLANDRWKTGELVPGGRAVILDRNGFGYKVMTSDGAEGWVSNFQVSRTLRQDIGNRRACE